MKPRPIHTLFSCLLLCLAVAIVPALISHGDTSAMAPKFLFGDTRTAPLPEGVTATQRDGGVDFVVAAGTKGWPGVGFLPAQGETWDLSPWGHVEIRVTNEGAVAAQVSLRVDNPGDWRANPWLTESVHVKPGETKIAKVVFGYQYGYKPAEFDFKPETVRQVLVFTTGGKEDIRLRLEDLQAAGAPGETPPVDPNRAAIVPPRGILLGPGAALPAPAKTETVGDLSAQPGANAAVSIALPAGKTGALKIKPAAGFWNLGGATRIVVRLRNDGATAAALPRLRPDSSGGNGPEVESVPATLAPGATAELVLPFAPALPWSGEWIPGKDGGNGTGKERAGTGTRYESHRTSAVTLLFGAADTDRALGILSVVADSPAAVLPAWLGKRPPVPGQWRQTLAEEFDGDTIDLTRWNVKASNYWDTRTHFSSNNVVMGGGLMRLRYENKDGFHNDDPNDKSRVARTSFVCGIADTSGKWTQRYGYFEARMKLPHAPGLWPAFWTMPDRGPAADPTGKEFWRRTQTECVGDEKAGGMEFDIMEHLTVWGPHRFNIACHWDGYGKNHKALGTAGVYVPHDADGFLTVGMLWLPGHMSIWVQGEKIAEWNDPRVSDVPAHLILYMVSGGWANEPLDRRRLPDEFVVDYVRAWQRADLQ